MTYQILTRRDTAANWTSNNPTLAQGERGFETDTKKEKIGDGVTAWTLLAYIDDNFTHKTGNETITGIKTFSSGIIAPSISSSPTISSGSVAPTSTPNKIGDIYVDTTNYKTYIAKGTSSSADWIKQNGSYELTGTSLYNINPVDATTYYFGSNTHYGNTMDTNAGIKRIYAFRGGIITNCYVHFTYTAGSSETSSLYIRVNNTTDYLVSNTLAHNGTYHLQTVINSLNIPLSSGDYIEFKWVTPTWATNPTNVAVNAQVLVNL